MKLEKHITQDKNGHFTHLHPQAYEDYPLKEPAPKYGLTVQCKKCLGHGGWNLALNSYKLHALEDTSSNRHRYSHFTCMCDNCHGWGYTSPLSKCDVHEWGNYKTVARCVHQYSCVKCGESRIVDSSD